VAAAQFADVVEMYARHHKVAETEARDELLELLGGSEEEPPLIDNKPRIVLVASDYRAEVTTTVLWLIENFDMDVRCVRLQPFSVDGRILVVRRRGAQRRRCTRHGSRTPPASAPWRSGPTRRREKRCRSRHHFLPLACYIGRD